MKPPLILLIFLLLLLLVIAGLSYWHTQRQNPYDSGVFFGQYVQPALVAKAALCT